MSKKIFFWYCSLALLILSVVPFFKLMLSKTVENVIIVFVWLAVSGALYVVATKMITFDKGYTAVEAIDFYKICQKENISAKSFKTDKEKIQKIAQKKDYSKKLEITDLYELYRIGHDLLKQKGH